MELEKLAAQYYAAEEGGGALYAAAERLRATLPETVRRWSARGIFTITAWRSCPCAAKR